MVPLRSLLKSDTEYVWSPEIDEAFTRVKSILTSDLVVHPFDPELKTVLITDASRLHGLGYLLMQYKENVPRLVQCGSFALTDHQKNYATIEFEFLAIVRAIDKCDFYLLGMDRFQVFSDHRPLEGIMQKELSDIGNARITKWRHNELCNEVSTSHGFLGKNYSLPMLYHAIPFLRVPKKKMKSFLRFEI